MRPLLEDLRALFLAEVLPLLSPSSAAVFTRVSHACRDVVRESPRPCAGHTDGVLFKAEDFLESNELAAWAVLNDIPLTAHTMACFAGRGLLLAMQKAVMFPFQWDERTPNAAEQNGFPDVSSWAVQRGCDRNSDIAELRAWRQQQPGLRALWDMNITDALSSFGGSFAVTGAFFVTTPERGWRLWQLVLNGLGLDDLPPSLGRLTTLECLDLCSNKLTSVPAALGQLSALMKLRLGDNRLTSIPAALGNLSALTNLDLQFNNLTSIPAALGNLSALTHLTLQFNNLTSIPAALGNLGSLRHLNLSSNYLTSLPEELAGLADLKNLLLQRNLLTSVPASLGGLSQLAYVNLGGNHLTGLGFRRSGGVRTVPLEWELGFDAFANGSCAVNVVREFLH